MSQLTPDEQTLIGEFLDAYNRIHHVMRRRLQPDNDHASFGELLQQMEEEHKITRRRARFLDRCRELRNHLVHNRTNGYMALPSRQVVERIQAVDAWFADTPIVTTHFQREVRCIAPSDTLYTVLQLIHEYDFSQYPVYDADDTFVGLLTENGITRWLAHHVNTQQIDLADLQATVRHALDVQEKVQNYRFVERQMSVIEALNLYAVNPQLEALLITEHGKAKQSLLGIMTRTDALDIIDGELNNDF